MMANSVDIVVLASGFSDRFGRENKLLHVFRGKPLVGHALSLACSLRLGGKVILVCSTPETAAVAGELPVQVVRNLRPERGLCESVRLGVAASQAGYYLFIHGDQPFLDAATIDAVASRRRPGWIVAPSHKGQAGTPALFSATFREELLTLPDGEAPRLLKRRHADKVELVEISDPLPLRDIDTLDDLRALEDAP